MTCVKKTILTLFLITSITIHAQTPKTYSAKQQQKGIAAFDQRDYKRADSLLSLAIDSGTVGYTYHLRALCKQHLGNRIAYCEDLARASELGYQDSRELYCKKCGTIDTTYKDKLDLKCNKLDARSIVVRYKNKELGSELNFKYDRNYLPFITNKLFADSNEISAIADTMPVFKGGNSEAGKFVIRNLESPTELIGRDVRGKVYMKFIVTKTGAIEDIEIVKGMSNCSGCNKAAVSVIKKMPNWQPALLKGEPVNISIIYHISFGGVVKQ